MASESETVIGVLAEWRDCIESADPSVWNDERIAGLVKATKAQQIAYLDRIEAAWKRDKAEAEADALAIGGIVEAARKREREPVTGRHGFGNAAATREALKFVAHMDDNGYTSFDVYDAIKRAKHALAAPPRVCDVNTLESLSDFVEKTILTSDLLKDTPEIVKRIVMDGEMYNKYKIEHTDGTPLKGKKYFVLRLDSDDPIEAARVARAMRAYEGKLRNCDVGTAEEQAKRFSFFCMRYHGCGKCDLNKRRKDCKFSWGQMPYEEQEGGAE